jgi:hypothetical protein
MVGDLAWVVIVWCRAELGALSAGCEHGASRPASGSAGELTAGLAMVTSMLVGVVVGEALFEVAE